MKRFTYHFEGTVVALEPEDGAGYIADIGDLHPEDDACQIVQNMLGHTGVIVMDAHLEHEHQ